MATRKILLFICSLFLLIGIVFADNTINFLTKGQADQLYCSLGLPCSGNLTGNANFTGVGSENKIAIWHNSTHLIYTNDVYISNNTFITYNNTLVDYILWVNSTNGEGTGGGGGNATDIWVNETGDNITGNLNMSLDKAYAWGDGSSIKVKSNGNMVFKLGT